MKVSDMSHEALENVCAYMKLYSAALYLLITYGDGATISDKSTNEAWNLLCAQSRNIARHGHMPRKVMKECCDMVTVKSTEYARAKQ
jgi:hypothetical protein